MRILLLAGSGEARAIASGIAAMEGVEAIASLAGVTERPAKLVLPTRVGGFGGDKGFRGYLEDNAIDAVLDATHPFAARISARTAAICAGREIPHSIFWRREWRPGPRDRWHLLDRAEEVAAVVPEEATVFLATGTRDLEGFANLRGRRVFCRGMSAPSKRFPFAEGEYVIDRPPFAVEDEVRLFRRLGIDWLVARNSGGAAGRSKLDAARAVGVEVALLRRPPVPATTVLTNVGEALEWVRGLKSSVAS